jgi:hypothetical protein
MNNLASNDACAICGKRTDPQVGPEFFLADSWALVCPDCADSIAPELAACLSDGRYQAKVRSADTSDVAF